VRNGTARPATGRAVAPRRRPFMMFLFDISGTGFPVPAAAALATTARGRAAQGLTERTGALAMADILRDNGQDGNEYHKGTVYLCRLMCHVTYVPNVARQAKQALAYTRRQTSTSCRDKSYRRSAMPHAMALSRRFLTPWRVVKKRE
jgi:hypothetical protein